MENSQLLYGFFDFFFFKIFFTPIVSENHKRLESNLLIIWLLNIDQITPPFYLEIVLVYELSFLSPLFKYFRWFVGLAIVKEENFSSLIDEELNKLRFQSLSLINVNILRNLIELDEKLERTFIRFRTGDTEI